MSSPARSSRRRCGAQRLSDRLLAELRKGAPRWWLVFNELPKALGGALLLQRENSQGFEGDETIRALVVAIEKAAHKRIDEAARTLAVVGRLRRAGGLGRRSGRSPCTT